jgi:DNA-binding transcriptional LysR family regulator
MGHSTAWVPRAVVPIVLQPLIASFCRAYPEVEVEIAASEQSVDLAADGFDAGIRLGQFIAPDMVAVRLTPPFRFVIVGSPTYLARSGRPERPEDLRHHACLPNLGATIETRGGHETMLKKN